MSTLGELLLKIKERNDKDRAHLADLNARIDRVNAEMAAIRDELKRAAK